jgi:hypothetical protein
MVSSDGRNNIITLGVLMGFSLLIVSFIFTFAQNMEKATDNVTYEVKHAVIDVKNATHVLVAVVMNMTDTVDKQLVLMNEEAERSKVALSTFLSAFKNQTNQLTDSINDLNRDGNKSRDYQTAVFVDTLKDTQNLTKVGQNITQYRSEVLQNQTEKLEQLIGILNLTLTPNMTLAERLNSTASQQ